MLAGGGGGAVGHAASPAVLPSKLQQSELDSLSQGHVLHIMCVCCCVCFVSVKLLDLRVSVCVETLQYLVSARDQCLVSRWEMHYMDNSSG